MWRQKRVFLWCFLSSKLSCTYPISVSIHKFRRLFNMWQCTGGAKQKSRRENAYSKMNWPHLRSFIDMHIFGFFVGHKIIDNNKRPPVFFFYNATIVCRPTWFWNILCFGNVVNVVNHTSIYQFVFVFVFVRVILEERRFDSLNRTDPVWRFHVICILLLLLFVVLAHKSANANNHNEICE